MLRVDSKLKLRRSCRRCGRKSLCSFWDGIWRCAECRAKHSRKHYANLRRKGRCRRHAKREALPGRSSCSECLENDRKRSQETRAARPRSSRGEAVLPWLQDFSTRRGPGFFTTLELLRDFVNRGGSLSRDAFGRSLRALGLEPSRPWREGLRVSGYRIPRGDSPLSLLNETRTQ